MTEIPSGRRERLTVTVIYECDPDIVTLTVSPNWNCKELQREPSAAQRKKRAIRFLD